MFFKYNIFGYDKDGYNRKGYNKQGFDRDGYDCSGYDIHGFNKSGYNKEGYDRDGYDKNGYNSMGYDRTGFNKSGYDSRGFDWYGFDSEGFNIQGYNKQGFNRLGYDREGFDIHGFDKNGYDKSGYNRYGFDKDGFDRNGYNTAGYDMSGYDKNGFDAFGYNRYGFDKYGYNKQGFDKNGFDKSGFDINGHKEFSLKSGQLLFHEDFGVGKFVSIKDGLYNQYIIVAFDDGEQKFEYPNSINKYLFVYDEKTMSQKPIVKKINHNKNVEPLDIKSILLSEDDKKRKNPPIKKTPDFIEEEKHLEKVEKCIDKDIKEVKKRLTDVDNETWWMDYDQKSERLRNISRNQEKIKLINLYNKIKARPYYARMDLENGKENSIVYIGEESYNSNNDSECNIYSVWSPVGKRYREKRLSSFNYNGIDYNILLRRNIDISNGVLIEIFDEYDISSKATKENITDPYLLKVLAEKKGEKNITNIIRSIQLNQNTIIDYDFKKNLLVQGCAGSGKTMILLHRLANMKFNLPNYDYSKVKIITPNKNFVTFIDDLSKNLHIEQISKITLAEYWADIIYRYRIQSGATAEYIENITIDETKLEFRKIIYSSDFALKLEEIISTLPEKGLKYQKTISEDVRDQYGELKRDIHGKKITKSKKGAQAYIDDAIQKAFDFYKIDIDASDKTNIECVLYARVLGIYYYYGQKSLYDKDNLLCIDEAQDISLLQYGMMLRVNNNSVILNIYGDLNQQIPSGCNIENWSSLLKYVKAEKFELNENYRNSEEIVKFYNNKLSLNNLSFGLKTKEVEELNIEEVIKKLLESLNNNNRTAIICNNIDILPSELKQYCIFNDVLNEKKAVVLTVKQAKGLEYDTVFVYDKDLTKNEKYIAYTRALSELYIIK